MQKKCLIFAFRQKSSPLLELDLRITLQIRNRVSKTRVYYRNRLWLVIVLQGRSIKFFFNKIIKRDNL